jgi:hypothetical protein
MAASGSNLRITYVEETTWGVTPTTPEMKILSGVTSESLGGSQESIVSNELNPNRGVNYSAPGQKNAGGDISFELGVRGAVSLLAKLLGNVATTGAGPYTHVLTVGTGPKSVTFEKWSTDYELGFVLRGCKPNGFNLAVNSSGAATGSINFLGKNYSATDTELDATPIDSSHSFFDGLRASVLVGGVSYDMVSLAFDGTNNLEDSRVIGKDESAGLTPARFDINGSFSIPYVDNVLILKAINGEEDDLKLTFSNGTHSIEFLFPRIKYFGDPVPKAGGQGALNVELSFNALLDNDSLSPTYKKAIQITVINDEAVL